MVLLRAMFPECKKLLETCICNAESKGVSVDGTTIYGNSMSSFSPVTTLGTFISSVEEMVDGIYLIESQKHEGTFFRMEGP